MAEITYITSEGLEKIKAELVVLKTKTRRELAERIDAAKALGDLSENAEYHEAKDNLSFVEGRIRQLEEMMKNISIIEEGGSDMIRIGSSIEVEVNGKRKTIKVVGSSESDPLQGLVSNESPIGKAFLGHSKGEDVEVQTPGGIMYYKIVNVS